MTQSHKQKARRAQAVDAMQTTIPFEAAPVQAVESTPVVEPTATPAFEAPAADPAAPVVEPTPLPTNDVASLPPTVADLFTNTDLKRLSKTPDYCKAAAAKTTSLYASVRERVVPSVLLSTVERCESGVSASAAYASAIATPYVHQYLTPSIVESVDARMDSYLGAVEAYVTAKVQPKYGVAVSHLEQLKEHYLDAVEKAGTEIRKVYSNLPQLEALTDAVKAARETGVMASVSQAQAAGLARVAQAWTDLVGHPKVAASIATMSPVLMATASRYNSAAAALNDNAMVARALAAISVAALPTIPVTEEARGAPLEVPPVNVEAVAPAMMAA